jgi:hypothetical protein
VLAYSHEKGAEQFVHGLAEPVQFAHELAEHPLAFAHLENEQRQMQNDKQVHDAEAQHVNEHVLKQRGA